MHAYIVTVKEHTFPVISLTSSRQAHSVAQDIINARRDSPLNTHRHPSRDSIRAAHDEWNVPLEPLEDGDEIRIVDHKQGVHLFWVNGGWADKMPYEPTDVKRRAFIAKLHRSSTYGRTIDA